jgi:S1-C subfamily serine protease
VRRALASVAALVVVAGCGGGGDGQTSTATSTATTTTARAGSLATGADGGGFDARSIYKSEAPGVVTLIALQGGPSNAPGRSSEALGSGFVIDRDGYIATNAHVITSESGSNANSVYVDFADGNRLSGRIVGTDPDSDVGLVKVDPSQLRGPNARLSPVPLGSTGELQVGDPVAAIGSPFGEEQSLSVGVVSGLNRDIQSLTNFPIGNAIQTDAAINHGNSGGPLLDGSGKVIGINSQIKSTTGGGEGVGFAIPVETVKHSVDQLRANGHVDYAYLGLSSVTLYPQLAERLNIDALRGAVVDDVVSGAPADKAGVRGAKSHITFQGVPGIPAGSDVITAVDDRKLTESADLPDLIAAYRPGDVIKLQVVRDNKPVTLDVTLGKRPGRAG